jgi:hypothetical protein
VMSIGPLRKRPVFFVREPKKIALYSKSLFDHYISSYLHMVLPRVFRGILCLFEMVKCECLYRKWSVGGGGGGWGRNVETLADHCQLSNMVN